MSYRHERPKGEPIVAEQGPRSKRDQKRRKARSERRRAKHNPECVPGYGHYELHDNDYW